MPRRRAVILSGSAFAVAIASLLTVAGCAKHDDDFIPYSLTGMNAWVYDPATDETFLAGFTPGGYESHKAVLASCAALASTAAVGRRIENWSYVCCTVTPESECATKVR